jgi:curved DNA-binding protein CbpA
MFMIDLGAPSHYSVLGLAPDAGNKEIRIAQAKICGEVERQRQRAREDEKRRLFDRLKNINRIGDELSNPARRKEYDALNAHLTFFLIRKAAAPMLEDRERRLRWVHQAVREFLLRKGEEVAPAGDLERTDFAEDYSPNRMLDDMLLTRRCK